MIQAIRHSSRFIMLALLVILMAVGGGCKSKKKAAEAAAAAEKARMEQEAAALKKQQEEEARLKREAEEAEAKRAAAEAAMKNPQSKLEGYFNAISNSGNATSANSSINEALTMFSSPDTPVLIVIHESGGQKDYDRPTTIKDYLNYLKDQKKKAVKIGNLQFDQAGKITEVELVKQQ